MAATCSCCGETRDTVQLHDHKEIQVCYDCLDWLNRKRDKQIMSHGGGWMVVGFNPIFSVANMPRARDHYTRMGFHIDPYDESNAFAHRDRDLTIHLKLAKGDASPDTSKLYIHCDDADQLADAERKAGQLLDAQNLAGNRFSGSTLQPLGINKTQSSRWQKVASLPDDAYETFCTETVEAGRELTNGGRQG